MEPRREKLCRGIRFLFHECRVGKLQENVSETPADIIIRHALTLQSGLNALAEKIEVVKSDHDKLERQNVALQDYIGGLTKSMSRTDLTTKSKK